MSLASSANPLRRVGPGIIRICRGDRRNTLVFQKSDHSLSCESAVHNESSLLLGGSVTVEEIRCMVYKLSDHSLSGG
jgi:hypothetical protein